MRNAAALVLLSLLAGCSPPAKVRQTSFSIEEYERLPDRGSGSIAGQAFLVTRGGDVKYAAGRTVWANPVTSYSTEFFERTVERGESLEAADNRAAESVRTATADAQGYFRFLDLPPGEYFVYSWIQWEHLGGFAAGYAYTSVSGGYARARCRVENGRTTEVVVTR